MLCPQFAAEQANVVTLFVHKTYYFYAPVVCSLYANTSSNSTAILDSLRTPVPFLIRKCKQLAAVVLNEFIAGRIPFTLGTYFIKFR
jgi:hypothetical protein